MCSSPATPGPLALARLFPFLYSFGLRTRSVGMLQRSTGALLNSCLFDDYDSVFLQQHSLGSLFFYSVLPLPRGVPLPPAVLRANVPDVDVGCPAHASFISTRFGLLPIPVACVSGSHYSPSSFALYILCRCERTGQYGLALKLLDEMRKRRIRFYDIGILDELFKRLLSAVALLRGRPGRRRVDGATEGDAATIPSSLSPTEGDATNEGPGGRGRDSSGIGSGQHRDRAAGRRGGEGGEVDGVGAGDGVGNGDGEGLVGNDAVNN